MTQNKKEAILGTNEQQEKSFQLKIVLNFHFHGTKEEAQEKLEEDCKNLEELLQVELCGSGLEYQVIDSDINNGTSILYLDEENTDWIKDRKILSFDFGKENKYKRKTTNVTK